MNKILALSLLLTIFVMSCATVKYTYIDPSSNLSAIRTFAFSTFNEQSDPLALKDKISHELIILGLNPVDINDMPDILVKFNYTNYEQSHIKGDALYGIKGASYLLFDNFTIQFYDNVSNNIILSSNYPKAVYLVKANNVLQVIFEDIRMKMKEHKQHKLTEASGKN